MYHQRQFIRPSSMSAIELCPGRPRLEAQICNLIPGWYDRSSPVAIQGTKAHDAQAHTLALIYHRPDGFHPASEALDDMRNHLAALEPWAADAARRCVAYCVALVDSLLAQGLRVRVEVEMHLPGGSTGIQRGGTADVLIFGYDMNGVLRKLIIEDTKTGFLDQGEACDHLQLHCYAAMAWEKYEPEHIEVHLAQGRIRHFSAASFTKWDVININHRAYFIVRRATEESHIFSPCINACRYCKALPLCAAARGKIMSDAKRLEMFGMDYSDRIKLDDDAKLARRFVEEAKELQAFFREQEKVKQQ